MALVEDDIFDPNTWDLYNNWEHRVYADDFANEWAIVDEVDYQHLIQWRWKLYKSKIRSGKASKMYLGRAVPAIVGPDTYVDGKRIQNRVTSTVYLHRVVMERKNVPQPKTEQKLIVDHANGNGFDCRRSNLRWATISFNNKNRFGSHERTLFDEDLNETYTYKSG